MGTFWEVKTENYYSTAFELKNKIPELSKIDVEVLESHLRRSGLQMVRKKSVKTPFWVRFTLPLAFTVLLILLITLPIKYMVTGSWYYKNEKLMNWFRSVGF
jgi:hypothetical protein